MALTAARWWMVLLGGVILGAGLLLLGQVSTMFYLREEVHAQFFLLRAIGQLTFVWQDDVTQAALWADEAPGSVLRESERAAWTMMVLGSLFAFSSFFLRRPGKRRRG